MRLTIQPNRLAIDLVSLTSGGGARRVFARPHAGTVVGEKRREPMSESHEGCSASSYGRVFDVLCPVGKGLGEASICAVKEFDWFACVDSHSLGSRRLTMALGAKRMLVRSYRHVVLLTRREYGRLYTFKCASQK